MAVLSGGDFQIEVRSAAGPPEVYAIVGDMHTENEDVRRAVSNFPVFDKSTPYRKVGKPDRTLSIDGYENATDAGQVLLDAAAVSGAEVKIRVTRDGAAGYSVFALVTARRKTAAADDETLQGRAYEFMFTTDPVAVP